MSLLTEVILLPVGWERYGNEETLEIPSQPLSHTTDVLVEAPSPMGCGDD